MIAECPRCRFVQRKLARFVDMGMFRYHYHWSDRLEAYVASNPQAPLEFKTRCQACEFTWAMRMAPATAVVWQWEDASRMESKL